MIFLININDIKGKASCKFFFPQNLSPLIKKKKERKNLISMQTSFQGCSSSLGVFVIIE